MFQICLWVHKMFTTMLKPSTKLVFKIKMKQLFPQPPMFDNIYVFIIADYYNFYCNDNNSSITSLYIRYQSEFRFHF